jgi:hypothetical protein
MWTMRTSATALLPLALLASSCGGGSGSDDARREAPWARATSPVATSAPIWAQDGVVHLGDGGTIRTARTMREYVVAGDGVYFLTGRGTTLEHATATGIRSTGVTISGWDDLRASPDGRYLAYIDRTTGPGDTYGTHLALAIVVDTTTGREVLRTGAGMGDVEHDDLADLYEDATSPQIAGITTHEVWVAGPDGVRTYDLQSGELIGTYDGQVVWSTKRPWVFRYGPSVGGTWNLERSWAIDPQAEPAAALHSAAGRDISPAVDAPYWTLDRWGDVGTVIGYAYDQRPSRTWHAHRTDGHPIMCRVPNGTCERIRGADGRIKLPRPSVG